MCIINRTTRCLTATGYKVAAKRGNRYYSVATGIEYKPGGVKIPKRQNVLFGGFVDTLLDPLDPAHVPQYAGMTGVFASLHAAREMRDAMMDPGNYHKHTVTLGYGCVILKMTLRAAAKRRILAGEYRGHDVFVGPVIGSIEETKTDGKE